MVNLKEIQASNANLKTSSTIRTAVFVGATQGIGKGTVIEFARNIPSPNVYIVGRSASKNAPLLDELKSINPKGTYTFIEGQISLIKDVDRIAEEIKSKEQSLDLLWLSAGALNLNGRQETAEGLDTSFAVAYYERVRFLNHLLPLLAKGTSPRVVSTLAAGQEAALDLEDLELRYHYTLPKEAVHTATMMALSLNHLAKTYPNVSFVYRYPGFVDTTLLDNMFTRTSGGLWAVLGFIGGKIIIPLLKYFASTSITEAGERGLFVSADSRYNVSEEGGNYFRLNEYCDPVKENATYEKMKTDGTEIIVWNHTQNLFDRVTAQR